MPSLNIFEKLGLSATLLLAVVLALLLLGAGSYTTVQLIEARYQHTVAGTITTVLETAVEALELWEDDQFLLANSLAREEALQDAARSLLEQPRNRKALLAADAQRQLRQLMEPFLEQYRGYFLIAPDNISLASSRDSNIGTPNLLKRYPDILAEVWNGKTMLTPVQHSDVPLTGSDGQLSQPGDETLFVATPVKDKSGKVIALLTLRIDPYKTLFNLAEKGRLGETGESYFVDREGILLSRSRFEKQLVQLGLLKPNQSSATNLRIADPGVDLRRKKQQIQNSSELPLTKMAAEVIKGNKGVDATGYRDYRGVPVVGAWQWDSHVQIGLATEQDVSEAYELFYFVRALIYSGATIAAIILLALVWVFSSGKRQLAQLQLRLQAIVQTANDGIVVIDDHGVIESMNPAMETIFGYTAEEMIGNNITMLMPEPHFSHHDEYLAHYRKTRKANIIGAGREVDGKRKEGSLFPMELSVNQLELSTGLHFSGIIRDISERKEAELAVAQERDFTRDVLDSLSAHITVLDDSGHIILTNRAWREFARANGMPEDQTVIGINYVSVVQGASGANSDEAGEVAAQLQKMLAGELETFSLEYPCHSPDEKRWFQMRANHFTHQDHSAIVVSHMDITQRKEAEKMIIKAQEEAISANRAKSTFLATMSHEIRTPLNGVVGTIEMLAHSGLDASQQDLVATAQDSATLLQGIIDDILDFSKIEAGRLELESVPIVLESLVEKLGENLQHIARNRGVELLLYVDPALPRQLKGDPVRLRQILYNLAGNAIKFSGDLSDRRGQVEISVHAEGRKEGRSSIRFSISDNGIGMPPEVQARLFNAFVQGEGTTTRRFGGTGLGLVITERLVEMMGGIIEIDSTEGEGSTFTIRLTLEEVESKPAETSNLEDIRVVLLTRDKAAHILTNYLQHAGAEVLSVEAEGIVERCKNECHSDNELVVVIDTRGDLEMSGTLRDTMRRELDDIELRFLLVERGNRRYARPHEDDGMTLDLNAMRRNTLLNAVATLVGRESPEQEKVAPLHFIPDLPLSIEEARRAGRLVLLVDDNPTNRKVIGQQLRMLGYLAEVAADGEEALKMWRQGNYGMLLTDCHMPVMDGYQLTEVIRREEEGGIRKPVIAITADALKGTAQRCFAAGMDDYLTKPLQLANLQQALDKWLPLDTTVAKQHGRKRTAKAVTSKAVDPNALGELLGTQESGFLAEYYNDFLETSTPTVGEMENAFREGELATLGSLAHKLKSAARTVGADTLADCCLALEMAGKEGSLEKAKQQMALLPDLFRSVREWIENYSKTA